MIVIDDGISSPSIRSLCEKSIGSTLPCMKYRNRILLLYESNQKEQKRGDAAYLLSIQSSHANGLGDRL